MIDRLEHSRRELDRAAAALIRMKEARSLGDFEERWRNYLGDLNRAWLKLEALAKATAGRFPPWLGRKSGERKRDMLLRYLHHARNAHEHTLAEIVERREPRIELAAGQTGVALVRRLKVGADGKVEFDGEGSLSIRFRPERLVLARVLDCGEWYDPPTHHLGQPLASIEPLHVAELGLRYYEGVVDEAGRAFFGSGT